MKKLLLFIVLLFGSMSAMSLADGCSAAVCTCPGGGSVSTGQYCPTGPSSGGSKNYYGALAINSETGMWASAYNHLNAKEAKESAMSRCGADCKLVTISGTACIGVAASKEDKTIEYAKADEMLGFGVNNIKKRAGDSAVKNCEKNKKKNCKIIANFCALENQMSF